MCLRAKGEHWRAVASGWSCKSGKSEVAAHLRCRTVADGEQARQPRRRERFGKPIKLCSRDAMLAPEHRWSDGDGPAPALQAMAETRKQGRPTARVVSLHADAGPWAAAPAAPLLPLNQPTPGVSTPPAAGLVAEPSCLQAGHPAAPGAPAAGLEAAGNPASRAPSSNGGAECEAAPRVVAPGGPAASAVAGSVEGSDASGASLSSSSSGADAQPAQRTRDIWGGVAAPPTLDCALRLQSYVRMFETILFEGGSVNLHMHLVQSSS